MRVGVDIRVLMDEYYSGVSEYAANLLAAILRRDNDNEYRLFYNSYRNLAPRLNKWNGLRAQVVSTRWPNKIFNYLLQKIFYYPKLDKVLGGVDIFWAPHFNFLRLSDRSSGLKKVITVADLSFLRYPEFFSARKNFWHQTLGAKKILRQADAIVAISENTKRDIQELAGIAPEKISVIYPGNNIAKREVSESEKQEFSAQRSLSGRFLLYLGNIEPRKNISGLIKAFNLLKDKDAKGANKLTDLKLILAGQRGWKNKKIYTAWQESPYQSDIIFLGYISQKEKEILYSTAKIFVYPSFYEGFGFPPLEAMTYGLPVVCSNVSSLPEVVGDAALMINPFQPEEIASYLSLVLNDEALRAHLITKGLNQAKLFSWDKAADEYLQLFKKVNADKP